MCQILKINYTILTIIIYLVILFLFHICEFKWSLNNRYFIIGAYSFISKNNHIFSILAFILFLIQEIYVIILFPWQAYILLIIPFLITIFNSARTLKIALNRYITKSTESGIPSNVALDMLSFNSELRNYILKCEKVGIKKEDAIKLLDSILSNNNHE